MLHVSYLWRKPISFWGFLVCRVEQGLQKITGIAPNSCVESYHVQAPKGDWFSQRSEVHYDLWMTSTC